MQKPVKRQYFREERHEVAYDATDVYYHRNCWVEITGLWRLRSFQQHWQLLRILVSLRASCFDGRCPWVSLHPQDDQAQGYCWMLEGVPHHIRADSSCFFTRMRAFCSHTQSFNPPSFTFWGDRQWFNSLPSRYSTPTVPSSLCSCFHVTSHLQSSCFNSFPSTWALPSSWFLCCVHE